MLSPITVSNDVEVEQTFNRTNPEPFPKAEAAIVSKKTGDFTGFFQDRVSLSPQAQAKSQSAQQINSTEPQAKQAPPSNEFIQVSSSIGRAASSGKLNREEAVAIYQKIASLI
ncbi:MAG: hypothetical protein ACI9FJ_002175 [Alteromonadaceae bacterium]|jgi:hypothetical protein